MRPDENSPFFDGRQARRDELRLVVGSEPILQTSRSVDFAGTSLSSTDLVTVSIEPFDNPCVPPGGIPEIDRMDPGSIIFASFDTDDPHDFLLYGGSHSV